MLRSVCLLSGDAHLAAVGTPGACPTILMSVVVLCRAHTMQFDALQIYPDAKNYPSYILRKGEPPATFALKFFAADSLGTSSRTPQTS